MGSVARCALSVDGEKRTMKCSKKQMQKKKSALVLSGYALLFSTALLNFIVFA